MEYYQDLYNDYYVEEESSSYEVRTYTNDEYIEYSSNDIYKTINKAKSVFIYIG